MVTLDAFEIEGPATPKGTVTISGAKNAALPALAASLLTPEKVTLTNVPEVVDVKTMKRLLEGMGVSVHRDIGQLTLQAPDDIGTEAPYELVRTMRASVLVLGPLVARKGYARVSLPGGCAIGVRPVDMHMDGLAQMGVDVKVEHGYIVAKADRLKPISYTFHKKTVTGTENLMMAAALVPGTTTLNNCAEEPEVTFMADILTGMGAEIAGAGTDVMTITGKPNLGGGEYRIIPDRIEAGTYLFLAAALDGSDMTLLNVDPRHLLTVLDQMRRIGVDMEVGQDRISIRGTSGRSSHHLETAPYPGFPTDLQAQYMALMTQCEGTSVIKETIFENRFQHVAELLRMGANIKLDSPNATIMGPTTLSGANVTASDLRASACLVISGLAAHGQTVIRRIYHLDRGYSNMEKKLQALGCSVRRIQLPHA